MEIKAEKISEINNEKNCCYFYVLSSIMRRKIISSIARKRLTVNELVNVCGTTQPTVSHHLSILYSASLVDKKRSGNKIFYKLNEKGIKECCDEFFRLFDHNVNNDERFFGNLREVKK